jgi:PAS domain S-box-containing protein/putative nucleotidyltransferase with HDIG domain
VNAHRLILSVARDITRRKQPKEAQQRSQDLAQLYLDIAGVMIVALDNQGRIFLINKRGCEILGYQEREIIGRDWFEVCLPATCRREVKTAFARLLAGEYADGNRGENPVLTKNGQERLIAFQNAVLRDQDSQISGVLCSGEDITERRQAESALRQSEQELSIRNRIAQIFLSVVDDTIYEAVLEVVLEAAESGFGIFGYLEENGDLVASCLTRQIGEQWSGAPTGQVFHREAWGDSILFRAIRESRTLIANEPAPLNPPDNLTFARSLTAPIRYCDKVIGVLLVADKATDYHDQDMRRLEMIADTIAPILQARLQSNQQEKARQRAEDALRLAAHKWRTTFDAIGDGVCLLDPEGRILQCNRATMTLTGKPFEAILGRPCWEVLHGAAAPLANCPLRRMQESLQREEFVVPFADRWYEETVDPILDEAGNLLGGVLLTTDITTGRNTEMALRESEEKFRTIFDQAAVGVALVETASGRFLEVNQKFCDIVRLTPDDLMATSFMAITHPDDLPAALENTQKLRDGLIQSFTMEKRYCHPDGTLVWVNLTASARRDFGAPSPYHIAVVQDITQRRQAEFEVRQGLDKLRQALKGTVGALANIVETKDPYTAGHQQRVAQLACAIARDMGWPPDQIEGMRVLSFLHDIGKIAVPAEILSRPGNISSIEFNLIRTHPEVGYKILKDIEFPWPVAQAVFQHHERLDGSGYPLGLSGQEIIREARILAVADVVEAMVSHRPYRPALGVETALLEITKFKGALFDADVVETCVRLFKEKTFTFR